MNTGRLHNQLAARQHLTAFASRKRKKKQVKPEKTKQESDWPGVTYTDPTCHIMTGE